jgi:hypothetical protein
VRGIETTHEFTVRALAGDRNGAGNIEPPLDLGIDERWRVGWH